ncbi:MAG: HAMP domain-containing histidine kinase [Polyangiaceae bacterium]|jgi:signal transduction histidine kinase|nr:HAMP domain-containing histidine kinase [Polyangiaceae bacterium]
MSRWWRIPLGPVFWVAAVQTAWTITLVGWILYFVERRRYAEGETWSVMVLGILLLVLMMLGVTVIVIHFGRQVAHNRAVKEFISRVSHDLRSPLATVKLHLETMQLRQLSVEQRQGCLDTALQELGRLESGIEDILTASRIERGGLKLTKESLEMGEFLGAFVDAKSEEVKLQGASISWEAKPGTVLPVRADVTLLRQMLDNLVDNAIVHGQPGVHIQLELGEHAGCAVIGVRDDGPGLDRSQWKRVFRMFYRAPGNRRHRKGTGLGLFIVASIAKAHGGRAWVESPPTGRGCQFRVAIPLAKDQERDL